MPLAKRQKAGLLKYGVLYRLSRFETGPNAGDWLVVVHTPTGQPTIRRRRASPKTPNTSRWRLRSRSSPHGSVVNWLSTLIYMHPRRERLNVSIGH